MRRLLALGLALAMVSGAVGCRHLVGICDCDHTRHCDPYGLLMMQHTTVAKTEPVEVIKVMPMEEKKPMD